MMDAYGAAYRRRLQDILSMPPLTSAQRKYLRMLAHAYDPMVMVGAKGVTDTLIRSVHEALDARELIKVRFNDFKDQKQPLIDQIAMRTNSQVVGVVGHVALFYRPQDDESKRKITLPGK